MSLTEGSKLIIPIAPVYPITKKIFNALGLGFVVLLFVATVQALGKVIINTWLIHNDQWPLMTAGIWEAEYFIYVVWVIEITMVCLSGVGLILWGFQNIYDSAYLYKRKG